jgi:hypothetical protein
MHSLYVKGEIYPNITSTGIEAPAGIRLAIPVLRTIDEPADPCFIRIMDSRLHSVVGVL